MNELKEVQSMTSVFSDRVLTINLLLDGSEQVSVRSCEVIGQRFRNRVSFAETNSIDDVLVEKLAYAIRTCLAKVSDGAHVLSLPDFLIELPGLALSGAHVMIMDVRNEVRSAIFRFREFIGSVSNAFRGDIGMDAPYATYGERLAVNVLEDICLPLLNVARELEFAQTQSGARLSRALEDKVREFEFQTELLKRFIHNSEICTEQARSPLIDRYGRMSLPDFE
jgi:hypothetical protein